MATLTIEMPDELREALREVRPKIGVRSDVAAARVAIAELCERNGVAVPSREDVIGPPPGTYQRPVTKKGAPTKKPARKPSR
jgi:hypothetical protein